MTDADARIPLAVDVEPLGEPAFAVIRTVALEDAGFALGPEKLTFVQTRLAARLRSLGISSFDEYCGRLRTSSSERQRLVEHLCVHETRFFREKPQLEFLDREVFPRWAREGRAGNRPRSAHVWSAGCSTGEEPFTLAMLLLRHFPPSSGWDVGVVASDVSHDALERARRAEWAIDRAAEIPPDLLSAWMLRGQGANAGTMKACPELRAVVTFRSVNLSNAEYGLPRFDVVACRNVLIYFHAQGRAAAVSRLLGHVEESGYLLLGHSEWVERGEQRAVRVMPATYQRICASTAR